MIVDTSALMAILFAESDAEQFATAIAEATLCRLSAGSFVEAAVVIESHSKGGAGHQLDALLREAKIKIEPVTEAQAQVARQAFLDFGKGRHPAGLNFGDCFAYALAKSTGEPLLFKGSDFARTDVLAALGPT
jgi:ribonuclease VapC